LAVPHGADGSVQFFDGATQLAGSLRVTGGVVFGPFSILSGGQHSITAVFIPSDPAAFLPSTSRTVQFRF
jgi:hypothetical protein